jgi:hypothetical protein
MRYAFRRPRAAATSSPMSPPASRPKAGDDLSVGQQLRRRHGAQCGAAWLAGRLGCPEETAAALADCWLPAGPAPLRQQLLEVLSRSLDIDANRLNALLETPAAGLAATPIRRSDSPRRAPAESPRAQVEITLGSNEGTRTVKQRQPTVIWRKRRVAVPA